MYDVDITLSLDQPFTVDSVDIELDCDDFADLRAVLFRGAPEIDAPHVAQLHFVDDDIQVCMDMPPAPQERPKYYAFGEALNCSTPFDWHYPQQLVLGDFGGLLAMGPTTVDDMYIAYRRADELGWIRLSLHVGGDPEVHLEIHQILPLCQGTTSVDETANDRHLVLHPNPSHGGTVRVTHAHDLRSITVIDATGRLVSHATGPIRSMEAPDSPGTYLVRAEWIDGRTSTTKLVRY